MSSLLLRFITLTGPSGSGKTTLQRELIKATTNVVALSSNTDRPPRPSDNMGDYNFWSVNDRLAQQVAGEVAWEFQFGDYWYWTRHEDLEKAEIGRAHV